MNRLLCLAAALATSLLAGCGTIQMSFEPSPTTEELPAAKKSPLHAGIYYSPEFAGCEHAHRTDKVVTTVPIGIASVQYLDQVLGRAFEKTTRIAKPTGDELSARGIQVVVTPSLEHFDFPYGMAPYTQRYSVGYRITLSTVAGVPVASWVVAGTAAHGWRYASMESLVGAYMNNAGAKLLQGFEGESAAALAAIAANKAGKSVPVEASVLTLSAKPSGAAGLHDSYGKRLHEAGVVAVEVSARQKGTRALVVRASDMRLQLKSGQVLHPSPVSPLVELAASPFGLSGFYPSPLGVAVAHSAFARWHNEREHLNTALWRTLFGDRALGDGASEQGTVFFRLPAGAKGLEGATLTAWVVDPATADGVQLSVPLASGE